jgi:hypothetical protein
MYSTRSVLRKFGRVLKDTSESWFDKLEPWLDRLLECLEVATVVIIALAIAGAIAYESVWIIYCPTLRQARLTTALETLNANWKAALILLVPLFYRTIRGFLERVEEFAGAKAPRKSKYIPQEDVNPPQQTQPEQEQES